jgi:hypothetical protein
MAMEWGIYLTIYLGNKLPPLYIGYSTVHNILHCGYRGTVCSKQYQAIWESELIRAPELFKTTLLKRRYDSKEEARQQETKLLNQLKAARNPLYINGGNGLGRREGYDFGPGIEVPLYFHPGPPLSLGRFVFRHPYLELS